MSALETHIEEIAEARATQKFAYSEAEAAELLYFASERALADFRRAHLSIGEHFTKLNRKAIYTPEHIRAILNIDRRRVA